MKTETNLSQGCQEYHQVSRRGFLGGVTAASVAAMLGASWLPRAAFAQDSQSGRDVLISIYLRGGIDGLTLCYPHGSGDYYRIRPNIAIPQPSSGNAGRGIDLDGFFGFPRQLEPLVLPYNNGHLLVVHAVGAPDWSRSHFDAQRWMEVGKHNDMSMNTGWLGRHLASVPPARAGAALRALSMTHGLRRTLVGAPQVLPVPDPDDFGFGGDWPNFTEMSGWINTQYRQVGDSTRQAVANTQNTIRMLDRINFAGYVPGGGAQYPDNDFGYAMKCTAALLKADVGLEAIHIDIEGWDTHADQGSVDGQMANLMDKLGRSLGAFYRDMAAGNRMNWIAVALSEFGRNARENGSRGTDHGTGNAMLVMGGAVSGRRVLRNWPGLADSQLFENIDLRYTIDYRDVLAEILQKRLANTNVGAVFPGHRPVTRGVIR